MIAGNLTEEAIQALDRVFSVVRWANKFEHVRDNIYKDNIGTLYYLDHLGFHTVNQFSNIELMSKEIELNDLIGKYVSLIEGDTLGHKSKHKVRKILSKKNLPDKEKVRLLSEYVNKIK